MGEGQPRGGCFKCGNPHHSGWECRFPVDKVGSSSIKKQLQDQRDLDFPATKHNEAASRMNKLMAKLTLKEDCSGVSWELIGEELERLIDFFLESELELEAVSSRRVKVEGGSAERRANQYHSLHAKIGSEMENTRNILACAREKKAIAFREGELSLSSQTRILFGKMEDLGDIRNRVWEVAVRRANVSRNVKLSLDEFRELRDGITSWCEQFGKFFSTKPTVTDYKRLDQQIVERKANLVQMKYRSDYLIKYTHLEKDLLASIEVIQKLLDNTLQMRSALENAPFTCPVCGISKLEVLFTCGHGACHECAKTLKTCNSCGSSDIRRIVFRK